MKKFFIVRCGSVFLLALCLALTAQAAKNAASLAGLAEAARVPLASVSAAEMHALTAPPPVDDVPAAQAAFIRQCQQDGLALRWRADSKAYDLVARDAGYMTAWRASCDILRQELPRPATGGARMALRSGELLFEARASSAGLAPGWYFLNADCAADLAGMHIEEYVGNHTWLVRVTDAGPAAPVHGAAALLPCHKVDDILLNADAYAIGDDPEYRVINLHGFHDTALAALAEAVRACNGEVLTSVELVPAVVARVPVKALAPLAAHDQVKWLGKAMPALGLCNDHSRATTGAEIAQAAPYSYRGTNVDVLVYDAGITDNHVDYSSRRTVGEPNATHYHATHVAGTVLGNGSASAGAYRGMAPEARLISYEYDFTGMIFYNNPGDLETNYFAAINSYGADTANNSIGMNIAGNGYPAAYYGDYETSSILMDEITRGKLGKPFLSVWAAGNERSYVTGYRNISPPQCAKNTMIVGATIWSNNAAASFTSWGPLDDGRLKPDLSAPGVNVNSCYSTASYQLLSGTSMASPGACGNTALLIECWRATHGGADPSPAMLKAILINTTLDVGTPGPGFELGYGVLQIVPALDTARAGNAIESSVAHNALRRFPVIVPATATVVRATIAWSDPPASALASTVLVNDVDLRLVDPSGRVFTPWVLDANNPANAATTNYPDRLNNVEQVLATNLTPGVWFAEVRGFNIAMGPTQTFALAANYAVRDISSAGTVQFDASAYRSPAVARIELRDWDLTNLPTYALRVSSTLEPLGESITLTQATPGLFLGDVVLTNKPVAADGVLSVANGSTVTVVYIDANDGLGGINVTNRATALIDLTPPTIFAVGAANISDTAATVQWQTDEPAGCELRVVAPIAVTSQTGVATAHGVGLSALTPGTTYAFYLIARDPLGNASTNDNGGGFFTFTTKLFQAMWSSTAEIGEPPAWFSTGVWHRSTRRPLAGAYSWYHGDDASGLYGNSVSSIMVSTAITVSTASASLRLREFISTESSYDWCYVQASTNNMATWFNLRDRVSGSNYVRDVVLPLDGLVPGILRLRFMFTSDSSVVREGWHLDNLQLGGYVDSDLILLGQSFADPLPGGDGDGFIEPSETIALRAFMFNGRSYTLTNLAGVLASSSPLVSIINGARAFGNVAAGTSASNALPFTFSVGAGATNGALLPFTLANTADDGTHLTSAFTLVVATRYSVAGHVRDIASHATVSNALVFWNDGGTRSIAADAAGAFSIVGLEPRIITVWADANGYAAGTPISITCPPDIVGVTLEIGRPLPVCMPASFMVFLPTGATHLTALIISNAGHGALQYTLAPSNNFAMAQGFDNASFYRWVDSDSPGCPPMQWIDISGDGQVITLTDDGESARLPLVHTFPYYTQTATNICIGANGAVILNGAGDVPAGNVTLPATGAPPEFIAPFWDDLNPGAGGTIYFKSYADKTVVSWINVPRYSETGSSVTFQLILFANGTIRYQYLGMNGIMTSATVGWQGLARSRYAQISYSTSYVRSNLVVAIGRGSEWLKFNSAGGALAPFDATSLPVTFDAQGLNTGVYSGAITLYSEAGNIGVPATMIVVPEPMLLAALFGLLLAARRRTA
jgi:hypothetical protein